MTQTKKLIRAKVGPLPWPRETRGKLKARKTMIIAVGTMFLTW